MAQIREERQKEMGEAVQSVRPLWEVYRREAIDTGARDEVAVVLAVAPGKFDEAEVRYAKNVVLWNNVPVNVRVRPAEGEVAYGIVLREAAEERGVWVDPPIVRGKLLDSDVNVARIGDVVWDTRVITVEGEDGRHGGPVGEGDVEV